MITFHEKIQLYLRSLFLQTGWNYRGMQNLGFLYATAPVLDRIWKDPEKLREAYKRHLQYFNTHPYLATVVMGVVLKMEEELSRSEEPNPKLVVLVKNRMAGPVAAVGDTLFWESLRPVLAALAAFSVFFFPARIAWAEISLGILLITFTFLAFFYRGLGLRWGMKHGLGVVDYLKSLGLQATARRIKNLGLVLAGLIIGYYLLDDRLVSSRIVSGDWIEHFAPGSFLIKFAYLAVGYLLVKHKISATELYVIVMITAVTAGMMGWF